MRAAVEADASAFEFSTAFAACTAAADAPPTLEKGEKRLSSDLSGF